MGVPGSANFLLAGAQGYQIERSLRFNSADSAYLNRTPASAGNRRKFTCSAWVKRTGILASSVDVPLLSAGDGTSFGISGTGALGATYDGRFYIRNGGANLCKIPNAVFRDPSAWYHFVFVIDTENATAADRQILYVNGVRQENFDGSFTQNTDTNINTTTVHTIGVAIVTTVNSSYSGNFLLAEYHFIDGQALTPSSFGEINPVTGVWQPKRYTGTYGTNGFYLNFKDNSSTSALGTDYSGNTNTWTTNNFSVTAGAGNDSMIDTPTPYADGGNGRGNYCTLNPLANGGTLANGNLQFSTGASHALAKSTFAIPSSGLWYAEATVSTLTSATVAAGFGLGTAALSNTAVASSASGAWEIYSSDLKYFNRNGTQTSIAGTFAANDVLQVAVDMANGRAWVGVNNTWYNGTNGTTGDPGAGTNPTFTSLPSELFIIANTYSNTLNLNFGQRPFAYTPPAGFLALNTQNLPEPSIKKPSSYMDVVTYTGTGSALTPTTGLGFSPDLVWIKSRSAATDHALYDAVRGTEKRLESNNTDVEVTSDSGVTAFNSAGFTLGTLAQVNTNAATYAAWCWDESATPGFDIVTYTGNGTARTIAHSLGVAPSMMIVKRRDAIDDWGVYHTSLGNTQYLYLDSTQAANAASAVWNNTSPSSSVFSVGTSAVVNANTGTYVAYLWSEVAGFSKFGSFTSNANSDGPYVHLGFRPKVLWIKKTTGSTNANTGWYIFDAVRGTYNVTGPNLRADLPDIESTFNALDFTSNGFKLRAVDIGVNSSVSGDSYIFCAWAESPAKYSLAR